MLETALLITETQIPNHFSRQTVSQNLGKIVLETTFGKLKMVYRPLVFVDTQFSQIPHWQDFVVPDSECTDTNGFICFFRVGNQSR